MDPAEYPHRLWAAVAVWQLAAPGMVRASAHPPTFLLEGNFFFADFLDEHPHHREQIGHGSLTPRSRNLFPSFPTT